MASENAYRDDNWVKCCLWVTSWWEIKNIRCDENWKLLISDS